MDHHRARQLTMRTLLTTIAICFFVAPSFASPSSDEFPDSALSWKEAAHPLLLAQLQLHVADDGRADADKPFDFKDLVVELPNYCRVADDFSCYKSGLPQCCFRSSSSTGCPTTRPDCEYGSGSKGVPTGSHSRRGGICKRQLDCPSGTTCYQGECTDVIPAGGACRSAKVCSNGSCRALNVCQSGYVCSNRRCRAKSHRIRTGGVCRSGDVCDIGTKCIQNRCIVPYIPAGGVCRFDDVCESGYFCSDNGRCESSRSRSIGNGGVCHVGDACESGTKCIRNRCVAPFVPPGGVCRFGDICTTGYLCVNGRCDVVRKGPGAVCQYGDVCESGYSCIDGTCTLPLVPPGSVCQFGDVCTTGYLCVNGRCDVGRKGPGAVCQYGDICESGYSCIDGTCALPFVPPASGGCLLGSDCTNNRECCVPGLACQPSQLNGSDRWTCQ